MPKVCHKKVLIMCATRITCSKIIICLHDKEVKQHVTKPAGSPEKATSQISSNAIGVPNSVAAEDMAEPELQRYWELE